MGVVAFSKSLSEELGPDNILVNNVCPGAGQDIDYSTPALRLHVRHALAGHSREEQQRPLNGYVPRLFVGGSGPCKGRTTGIGNQDVELSKVVDYGSD